MVVGVVETIPPSDPAWWLQWWWVAPNQWFASPLAVRVLVPSVAVAIVAPVIGGGWLWPAHVWRERDLLRKYRPGHQRH